MSKPKYLIIWLLLGVLPFSVFSQAPRIVINPMGHSARINNLLFTPDGERVISISEDKTIRVWSVESGEMVTKFESEIGDGGEGMLYSSAISPDGKLLAVAGFPVGVAENYIIIIDLEKKVQVSTAIGHSEVIGTLSFSGDGGFLASGSNDGTVKLWKMDNAKLLSNVATIAVGSVVSSLSFNPKNDDLAVVSVDNDILVYNLSGLKTGSTKFQFKTFKKHKGQLNKVLYSPDGMYLCSTSFENEMILWKADGSVVKEFTRLKDIVNAIAFSSDAKILVSLDVAGKGASWSIPGGTKFTDYEGHDNTVFSAAFSPTLNGNYIVASAGGVNNEILLWNPINGLTARRIKGKGSVIQDLAFGDNLELYISQDLAKPENFTTSFNFGSLTVDQTPKPYKPGKDYNKDLVQTGVNTIQVGKKVIQTDEEVDGRILDFQGLPDGSVAVASDFSLKLFDRNGYILKELIGHIGAIRAVTVTPDGKYLASGGVDQSIILWKLSETGNAPSIRKVFEAQGKEWTEYFDSLPVDSLTREPTKKAWNEVITFLKNNNDKTYKQLEAALHSLGEIVIPFATLFVTADEGEWVCWTPRGYFSCSSAGSQYFGWHVNRGINQLADFYAAEQYFDILYRPREVAQSITQGKRVEEILKETGERIFDLGKLHRPSAGFFDMKLTMQSTDLLRYDRGKFYTQARTMPITVEAFDGGGGIKEIAIYQNDKLVISDTVVNTRELGQKVVRSYAVEMVNETNEFKVKVINYQKIESRVDVLKIEYAGEAIATSSLHILAIGINKYKNEGYNLNYAQSDAASVVDKLMANGNSIFKSINRFELYDEEATKENIIKSFKAISARAKPEDVFVFYYAGHGTIDEENDNEYYLVPTDVTKLYGDSEQLQQKAISATELRASLTDVKSQKQMILMDACHSGGALKSLNVRAAGTDEKAIVQLARSSGVAVLASSGTKQFATEFEELKHGVFTFALMEALDGEADRNKDNRLTVSEIKLFMDERVPELTKQYGGTSQYPTGYLTGNDFPISIRKTTEADTEK